MAPANGILTNDRNGHKTRVQPVLPALPLNLKAKNGARQQKRARPVITETPQVAQAIQVAEKIPDEDDTTSQKSLSKGNEHLNEQQGSSTPSVSALDDSLSAQSSQDHAPAVENDSSVTSALTIESFDPSFVNPQVPASESTDAAISIHNVNSLIESAQPQTRHTAVNARVQIPQENGAVEFVRTTPSDDAPLIAAVSPLTNLSSDKVPVELSAYASSTASVNAHVEASPEAVRPYNHSQAFSKQNPPFPRPVRSGTAINTYASNISNGHHSTNSIPKPLPTILEHLLFLANSKHLVDWAIQIDQPGLSIQPFITYAHAFVLMRSDRMRKLMTHPAEPIFNLPAVRISPVRAIQPHAFEAALRFIYSDTVLSVEALFPRDTYMDRHARAHIVDYVLSYWIAGIELGLEPVSSRAYTLLAGMIDWDIAELLVREALSLRNLAPPRPEYQPPSEPFMMGESILRLVLGLFVHRFDVEHFKLDTNCQPVTMYSRFAQLDHARTASNPVLAGMVFGSMPSSADLSPAEPVEEGISSTDSIASSILLNLDFADLNNLSKDLLRTYGSFGAHIMSEVIEERERRRQQILNNKLIPNKERMTNPTAWDIIGWQESFEQGQLHRERVGYVLPSKKHKHDRMEI